MKIGIGNDSVPLQLGYKQVIIDHIQSRGHEVIDYGAYEKENSEYYVFGEKVGRAVAEKEVDCGVLICGTGVGIGLAANKVQGIRCATCSEPYTAKLSRLHNDSNILSFGARVVGIEMAKMMIDEWLDAEFEGGRHARRVEKLMEIGDKK